MLKVDYQNTECGKRLLEIAQSSNGEKLLQRVLNIVHRHDEKVIIFDPFNYWPLEGISVNGYLEARSMIECGVSFYTVQMGLLDIVRDYNYRVYIVNNIGEPILISNETLKIDRVLRPAHNLFKMWRSGALGDQFL